MNEISVVMCTYNGELYIREQLESILNQTVQPDEIIISDDNSDDKTTEIAETILKNTTISYNIIVNETTIGVLKNFENAINEATKDIIFFSDQDDIWDRNKTKLIIKEFIEDPELVMVFTDAELVDHKRNKLNQKLWSTLEFSPDLLESKSLVDILLNRSVVTGATMAYKRKVARKIMPFPNSWLHDGWLAINASNYGAIKAIEIPLIEYRQHSKNVIGAGNKKLYQKIIKYVMATREMKNIRVNRYNRYNDYFKQNFGNSTNINFEDISNCKAFWCNMISLNEIESYKGISIIMSNLLNGSYRKFYTGIRGALRDFLYLVIRKD